MSHLVGVGVQTTSRPLVMASLPLAAAEGALPAEALLFDRGGLRLGTDQIGVAGAVGLAEAVATDDECGGLLVVHRHPAERLTDVDLPRRSDPAYLRGLPD